MKNITKVRTYSQSMPLAEAVEKAIKECIQEDVLSELLRRNQAEVYMSSLFEYDEEKQRMMDRRDAKEEGMVEKQICVVRKLLNSGMNIAQVAAVLEEDVADIELMEKLMQENPDLSDEKLAKEYIFIKS